MNKNNDKKQNKLWTQDKNQQSWLTVQTLLFKWKKRHNGKWFFQSSLQKHSTEIDGVLASFGYGKDVTE